MEDTQLTYYGGYYEPLKQLEQEVLGWLNERVDELDGKHQERSVEHIRSRIKTAEGVQEKLERKGYDNDVETAFTPFRSDRFQTGNTFRGGCVRTGKVHEIGHALPCR